VLLIQILAATLLLAGSALIFRALVAMDFADAPKPQPRPRVIGRSRRESRAPEDHRSTLPRAA
jgi:hypothetical protein